MRALTIATAVLTLCSCEATPPAAIPPEPPVASGPVASVELTRASDSLAWPGIMWLTPIVRDTAGREFEGEALARMITTWSSSDTAYLRVHSNPSNSPSAYVSATELLGTATVTVTVDGKVAQATLTTYVPSHLPMTVWPDTSRLPVSNSRGLSVERTDAGPGMPRFVRGGMPWESSDPAVATVDSMGKVTAVGEGRATISAVFPNRRLSAEVHAFRYPAPLEFTSLASGDVHTCGITTDGVLYCWGLNGYGQLGTDAVMDRCERYQTMVGREIRYASGVARCSEAPIPVNSAERFASLSAAKNTTCAVTLSGKAYCWGANYGFDAYWRGKTGTGLSDTIVRVPTPVAGGLTFRIVDVGIESVCGVTTSDAAYCWGRGALGTTSTQSSAVPVEVAGGLAWHSVRVGFYSTCGVTTNGAAYCWGTKFYGGAISPNGLATPTRVATDLKFAQTEPLCGLTPDGSTYCWGWSITADHGPPSLLPGGLRLVSLQALRYVTWPPGVPGERWCGVTTDGSVACWSHETLPNNTDPTQRLVFATPALRSLPFSVSAFTSAATHQCAIAADRVTYCWDARSVTSPTSFFWAHNGTAILVGSTTPVVVAGQR